jgi:hypothetical protein
MHPGKVIRLARQIGFARAQAFPRISEVGRVLLDMPGDSWLHSLLPTWWWRGLTTFYVSCFKRRTQGITVLVK